MTRGQMVELAVAVCWLFFLGIQLGGPARWLVVVGVFTALVYCAGPLPVWHNYRQRMPLWDAVSRDELDGLSETTRRFFFNVADRAFVDLGFSLTAYLTGAKPGAGPCQLVSPLLQSARSDARRGAGSRPDE
jgi:hypothetical protein